MTSTAQGSGQRAVEPLSRASVRVGPVETWYSTWGRGSPALVFLALPLGWAPASWLSSIAAPRTRLILPELPAGVGATEFSGWFGDFLDGLGIESASVAAESSFDTLLRSALMTHRARIQGSPRWIFPPYRS